MFFVKDIGDKEILRSISEEYDVEFEVKEGANIKVSSDDSLLELSSKEAIEAYSLGFSIQDCMKVFNERVEFSLINLRNQTRNSKRSREQKARVIGEKGRTKQIFEEMTETSISVKDFKIGIIGRVADVYFARSMLEKLINGTTHARVYSKLEEYNSSKNEKRRKNRISMEKRED